MRKFINLVEAIDNDKIINDIIDYLSFNGHDISKQDARSALEDIEYLSFLDNISIYRIMRLESKIVKDLKPLYYLGIYWSEDENIPKGELNDDGHHDWYTFKAVIKSDCINYAETAGTRILFPEEKEIRIKHGKKMKLLSIKNDQSEIIRPDLYQKIFKA